MLCKHPFVRDPKGQIKWSSKLTEEERLTMTPFACGRCLPCRINKRRVWTARILLEAKNHLKNTFVTLTYTDEFLPVNLNDDMILIKRHLQNYIKRLRKKYDDNSIRYFAVGEYGDLFDRPHFHICLFGLGRPDESKIESAWHHKGESIGKVDFLPIVPETAQYAAGYTIKKLTKSDDYRLYGRTPEFCLSSKGSGGIGAPTIRRIAQKLCANPYTNTDDLSKFLDFGSRTMPIGDHLEKIYRNEFGQESFSWGQWEDQEPSRKRRLLEVQKRLFLKNDSQSPDYYHHIVDEHSSKIKDMEVRLENSRQYKLHKKKERYNAKKKQFQLVS